MFQYCKLHKNFFSQGVEIYGCSCYFTISMFIITKIFLALLSGIARCIPYNGLIKKFKKWNQFIVWLNILFYSRSYLLSFNTLFFFHYKKVPPSDLNWCSPERVDHHSFNINKIFHVTRNSMFFCLISDIRDRPHNFGGGCYDFSNGRTQIFTRDKSRNFMLKTTGSYLFLGHLYGNLFFCNIFQQKCILLY